MRDALGALQRVLLLGGRSEIGLAIVRELAKSGRLTHLTLALRKPEADGAVVASLTSDFPALQVRTVHFDATDESTFEKVVDSAFSDGPIDCVISAFGVLGRDVAPLGDLGGVERMLQINYVAPIVTGTLVINRFQQQGHGSLVVLSSVAAERPRFDNYVYASTKAGVDSWACGLADSLADTGIDVIVVRPGFVQTKMTEGLPLAPLATTPNGVAVLVAAAIRNRQPLVWAPKGVRPLMSVLRHAPRPVFRVLAKRASNG